MNDSINTTRFGLLRHAETVWNRKKIIQGHSDSPLTAKGGQQAQGWGTILKQISWDRILCSDTGRAAETARIINRFLNLPLTSDKRLREQDWGLWTGMTVAQLKDEDPQALAKQERAGWEFCPPRGESRLSVWKRSRNALIQAAETWTAETVMVVTHEGVIKSLIYRLSGRKFLPQESPMLNKSYYLHWLHCIDLKLAIEKLNAIDLDGGVNKKV
jgi:probable phosphoglycerate mutase